MSNEAINQRYTLLSKDDSCCLSCGGAVFHAEALLGDVCVDLGSGRGNDVMRLAEKVGPKGHVYGIDLSEGMVAKAKANLEKFAITNATILKAELEHLPLQDGTVDLVISNCTINHSADKQGVWNEVFRILRTGGRFVVSDIYATQPIPEEYRNDPEAVAECWAGSVTKPEYLQMLLTAGFKEIRILEESQPYAKGKAEVCSFTISGVKRSTGCCCC
ncbi:MAG TPA: methyltransferase domain-containing protein [Bacteroidales bacterium]|nr:methyltransferase domain-containing protein [Bacteroidales bacterium]